MANRSKASPKSSGVLQVRIALRNLKPAIWRRILVPKTIALGDLHWVIQAAMPWTNSHLHEFRLGQRRFGMRNTDFEGFGEPPADEESVRLSDLLRPRQTILYEYDFGDGWQHDVKVEKELPADPKMKSVVCLEGENACPPDDCGGVGGYCRLIEILADSEHEEHDEMKEWIGGEEWDPFRFDLKKTNARLKRIRL